jgi:hypothetical protein
MAVHCRRSGQQIADNEKLLALLLSKHARHKLAPLAHFLFKHNAGVYLTCICGEKHNRKKQIEGILPKAYQQNG